MSEGYMLVEVVYALPDQQELIEVELTEKATIADAIAAAQIETRFPELDLSLCKVGVFGKLGSMTTELSDKDRVEIYRPLIIDPKEARRERARSKT